MQAADDRCAVCILRIVRPTDAGRRPACDRCSRGSSCVGKPVQERLCAPPCGLCGLCVERDKRSTIIRSMPRVLRVDPREPDAAVIAQSAQMILDGLVVAYPTDTLYGLAIDPRNPAAV